MILSLCEAGNLTVIYSHVAKKGYLLSQVLEGYIAVLSELEKIRLSSDLKILRVLSRKF